MTEFKIKLIGYPQNPQTLVVAAARGCFEEKSAAQIMEELLSLPEEERKDKERIFLKNSFGRGHGSIGDQVHFTFNIEGLPRVATLLLCSFEYLEHLQQSLRRAKASRGFYLPEKIRNSSFKEKTEKLFSQIFEFYERLLRSEEGIPSEDARFLLPLYTKTNITTTGNIRELSHLSFMVQYQGMPSVTTLIVKEMIKQVSKITPSLFEDFGFNYEPLSWHPSSQLFAPVNKIINQLIESFNKEISMPILLSWSLPFEISSEMLEKIIKEKNETELANLKHLHFEFLVPMSLACFHQAVRQRTWNHSIESIYEAVEDAVNFPEQRIVIPPTIKDSKFLSEYKELHFALINLYKELLKAGISKSEAIGVIPHSLKIYDWIHINGWNAIHSIGKRTCLKAQWEIRFIAQQIANKIKEVIPAFKNWAKPQCIIYGKCPEIKECGYYKKFINYDYGKNRS